MGGIGVSHDNFNYNKSTRVWIEWTVPPADSELNRWGIVSLRVKLLSTQSFVPSRQIFPRFNDSHFPIVPYKNPSPSWASPEAISLLTSNAAAGLGFFFRFLVEKCWMRTRCFAPLACEIKDKGFGGCVGGDHLKWDGIVWCCMV